MSMTKRLVLLQRVENQAMTMDELLKSLVNQPDKISFDDVISVIDENYSFTPVFFANGDVQNNAGQNSGSCKIFAFAQANDLTEQQTLHCFGDYYRNDVLLHPEAENHQNIRNFMKTGWSEVKFEQLPLQLK